MRHTFVRFLLFHVCSVPVSLVQADTLSGHHYSWLEGAAIGHDFGRNPWSRGGTEGFAGSKGRANLREALARAVAAGETAQRGLFLGIAWQWRGDAQDGDAYSLTTLQYIVPIISNENAKS